ncbi:syntaxin-6 [Papilio machaon]|uniref:syntaxin-6 n=1 Tax=Papilio machaon TaxID=76193 RepID=UPI0006EAD455|nr:syntaxin-6 [Papilio machaon]
MTLEDPFYVVKDEVFKALNKTRGLYLRWQELSKSPTVPNSPEVEWTSTELKNALRSIEWDLEDLEDTISIVEKNSSKFKIDNKEICERRAFIEATKKEVKVMKGKMTSNRKNDIDGTAREPLLGEESPIHFGNFWATTPQNSRYSRLANQTDSPPPFDMYESDIMSLQEEMLMNQDNQLNVISNSAANLKTVSKQIGNELDEQAVMLDDMNTVLENTGSRLDSTVKKVARVLQMNNDRRQWLVILILIGILLLILLLFIIL